MHGSKVTPDKRNMRGAKPLHLRAQIWQLARSPRSKKRISCCAHNVPWARPGGKRSLFKIKRRWLSSLPGPWRREARKLAKSFRVFPFARGAFQDHDMYSTVLPLRPAPAFFQNETFKINRLRECLLPSLPCYSPEPKCSKPGRSANKMLHCQLTLLKARTV